MKFFVCYTLCAAEVIEVCFPIIYKECPLRRTLDQSSLIINMFGLV